MLTTPRTQGSVKSLAILGAKRLRTFVSNAWLHAKGIIQAPSRGLRGTKYCGGNCDFPEASGKSHRVNRSRRLRRREPLYSTGPRLRVCVGFGSGGQTCWRRLDRWQEAGVFDHCIGSCSPSCMRSANSTGHVRVWAVPTPGRKRAPTPARRRSTGRRRAVNAT